MRPEDFALCVSDEAAPVLNEATRRHLFQAATMLVDQLDEDLDFVCAAVARNPDVDVWKELNWTREYLPPDYAATYDISFLRQFHLCVLTVIYKLGGDWSQLSSVAEELAMNALLRHAVTLIDLRADAGEDVSEVDLGALWDIVFWDLDFETLFMQSMDGLHHSDVGRRAGMANLDRSEWFTMFDGAEVPPHPLTW